MGLVVPVWPSPRCIKFKRNKQKYRTVDIVRLYLDLKWEEEELSVVRCRSSVEGEKKLVAGHCFGKAFSKGKREYCACVTFPIKNSCTCFSYRPSHL